MNHNASRVIKYGVRITGTERVFSGSELGLSMLDEVSLCSSGILQRVVSEAYPNAKFRVSQPNLLFTVDRNMAQLLLTALKVGIPAETVFVLIDEALKVAQYSGDKFGTVVEILEDDIPKILERAGILPNNVAARDVFFQSSIGSYLEDVISNANSELCLS